MSSRGCLRASSRSRDGLGAQTGRGVLPSAKKTPSEKEDSFPPLFHTQLPQTTNRTRHPYPLWVSLTESTHPLIEKSDAEVMFPTQGASAMSKKKFLFLDLNGA